MSKEQTPGCTHALLATTTIAVVVRLALGGATLLAQGQTAASWVPYQIGCPILLVDLKTDAEVLFESIDVQNVSSNTVDEITLGVLAGPRARENPRRLVTSRTVVTSIAPGQRRRIPLQLDMRDAVPLTARRDDFLMTLGVIQVRDRAGAVWVSPVTIAGEFEAATPPTHRSQPHHACMDERRRLYPPGAVLFDQRHVAQICLPNGTWAPR